MAFAGKVYGGREVSGAARPVLLVAGALILCGCAQKERRVAELHAPRAIWVTRWDYKTPQDIERILDDVSGLGLDTVLFQVRGEGTVMYRSRYEPWAGEFGGRDPGFDLLAVAVAEAHRRGLSLHAWINTMPGWKGTKPPADPRQLYNAHPDWFLYDRNGRRQPLSDHYVFLNPALREVRDYIAAVCREIIRGYDVDGLHLDYIRFVTDESGVGRDYPYDHRTVAGYRGSTGLHPGQDPRRWHLWREQQVTAVVREIRGQQKRFRPEIALTAAVLGDRRKARSESFQDAEAWLNEGLVDAVLPMAYRQTPDEFARLISDWRAHAHGNPVIPGIGIYNHRSDRASFEQIRMAAQWGDGFALFAYSSLFARSGEDALRARQRLAGLSPVLKQIAKDAG
jgi:uncharacterized lipoprotein YddW (UPF0748 family)